MANVLDATLYKATLHNDIKAVEDALNKGANPNANDFNWNQSTALIEACKNGNKDICLLLISKGAQIGLMDKYDNHPIHYACLNGHSDIAEILVQNGADVNIIGYCRHTPLHYACSKKRGNRKVIRKLISMGADVNRMGHDGWTPLMVLAENCLTGTMKELIDAGADKTIKNKKNNTAEDILGCCCPDKLEVIKNYIRKTERVWNRAQEKRLKKEDQKQDTKTGFEFDI
ncbi:MAG: ankyrin repeat domain-containing protein [Bacteroidales bacterium]|nr:ankyrin repeat domain-containing protein [Bacteroidales bacterium]